MSDGDVAAKALEELNELFGEVHCRIQFTAYTGTLTGSEISVTVSGMRRPEGREGGLTRRICGCSRELREQVWRRSGWSARPRRRDGGGIVAVLHAGGVCEVCGRTSAGTEGGRVPAPGRGDGLRRAWAPVADQVRPAGDEIVMNTETTIGSGGAARGGPRC